MFDLNNLACYIIQRWLPRLHSGAASTAALATFQRQFLASCAVANEKKSTYAPKNKIKHEARREQQRINTQNTKKIQSNETQTHTRVVAELFSGSIAACAYTTVAFELQTVNTCGLQQDSTK